MQDTFITFSRIAWLIGVAILVLIANVAVSVLYMVVYGHVIDPGHDQQYYNDHIQLAAPYCSIVAGIPLMFLAGWWVGHWWQRRFAMKSAVLIWLAYGAIDLTIILLAGGLTSWLSVLVGISLATKLASVCLGASFAKSSPQKA